MWFGAKGAFIGAFIWWLHIRDAVIRLEAITIRLEAIAIKLEAIVIRLEGHRS